MIIKINIFFFLNKDKEEDYADKKNINFNFYLKKVNEDKVNNIEFKIKELIIFIMVKTKVQICMRNSKMDLFFIRSFIKLYFHIRL